MNNNGVIIFLVELYRNIIGGVIYFVCKIDCMCFIGIDFLYIGELIIVLKYLYLFIFSYFLVKNIIMFLGYFELKFLCINFF